MSLSLAKWIQLIESESDVFNETVTSLGELGEIFNKYNIKQINTSDDEDHSILYKYITKSVGDSTSGESSTKDTFLGNVLLSATDNGDDVSVTLKLCRAEDKDNNQIKTGVWLVNEDVALTSIAALCGISIDTYTLGKSLNQTIKESGFDWGPYSIQKNGENYVACIGHKKTSNTAVMYMPETLLKSVINALDEVGLFDGHPAALEPHYNEMHVYSFDNRFPPIPDKYVDRVQKLVDNFNIDIYNNYIAIAISAEGDIRLWLFYADYRPAYRQTYRFNYRHALMNTNEIVENSGGANGTLILTVENFESGNHYTYFDCDINGNMSQGPIKTYNYFSDTTFKTYHDSYCYDNLGYNFRKIEGSAVGEYKIGGSTAGLEDIYVDPNAVDLRTANFVTDMPNWWAKRLYVSAPDTTQGTSTDSTYPDDTLLNKSAIYLPVKLAQGAVNTTLTQTDELEGDVDENDVNVSKILDQTEELAPEVGSDLIFKPDEPPINTPALPSDIMSGVEASGLMCTIVSLDDANVRNFASWLYSTDFSSFINNLLFNNAMEGIISLKHIYKTPRIYMSGNLRFLGQAVSNVGVNACFQYKSFSCGHIKINPYYKNVNDYTSTSIQLYLPFIGFVDLNVNEVMDRFIEVKYYIDYLTGTCTAYVLCSKTDVDNSGYVMLVQQGNCAVELPLSGMDYSNAVRNIISLGTSIATGSPTSMVSSVSNLLTGGINGTLNRGGGIGGNSGAIAIKTPYIIINRQVAYDALQRQHFEGLPNNANVRLSTCKGYTRIKYINLDGIDATEQEKDIILNKLKGGVFI